MAMQWGTRNKTFFSALIGRDLLNVYSLPTHRVREVNSNEILMYNL